MRFIPKKTFWSPWRHFRMLKVNHWHGNILGEILKSLRKMVNVYCTVLLAWHYSGLVKHVRRYRNVKLIKISYSDKQVFPWYMFGGLGKKKVFVCALNLSKHEAKLNRSSWLPQWNHLILCPQSVLWSSIRSSSK